MQEEEVSPIGGLKWAVGDGVGGMGGIGGGPYSGRAGHPACRIALAAAREASEGDMTQGSGGLSERVTMFQIVKDTFLWEGVRALLEGSFGLTVVGESDTSTGIIPRIRELGPDVIVCGMRPPVWDAVKLVSELAEAGLQVPVLAMSRNPDPSVIREVARSRVAGFLVVEETSAEQLALAIRVVKKGLTIYGPGIREVMSAAISPSSVVRLTADLTEREQALLNLMVQGLNNKEIAGRLAISPRTAQAHTANVFKKMGASSRVEAVLLALQMKGILHEAVGQPPLEISPLDTPLRGPDTPLPPARGSRPRRPEERG